MDNALCLKLLLNLNKLRKSMTINIKKYMHIQIIPLLLIWIKIYGGVDLILEVF